MPSTTVQIANLLDYEAQLAQDALEPIQNVIQRDRAIGQKIPAQNDRRALLFEWLDAMRAQNPHLPGRTWIQTNRFTVFACVVLGFMSGSGFIRTLLSYDGTQPVSVFPFLGFFVFLQLFFLAMLAFASLARPLLRSDAVGFFPGIMLKWLRTNIKDVWRRKKDAARSREFFKRFHALHGPLEGAVAMKYFQTFVLSFHVAALITLLYTIAFSDIAFSWATTPRLSPPVFHEMILIIATPFAWISDALVPNLRFIELTQYSRLAGSYVLAPAGARLPANVDVGAWWPFLAACIATYGILPRFLLILWEKYAIRRYLRRRSFDDHASLALEARLTKPAGVWTASETKSSAATPAGEAHVARAPRRTGAPYLVLKWFGFPAPEAALTSYLEAEFHLEVGQVLEANGTASDLQRVLEALRALARGSANPRLLIAADPWEVPGEAAESMLRQLRSPPFEHLVCLFAPLNLEADRVTLAPARDLAIWRQSLRSFRDPYAGLVVDLGEPS